MSSELRLMIAFQSKAFEQDTESVILAQREDSRMVNYQPIAALVNLISVDTLDVLRQIKERRPGMMLSELIDCRTRASKRPERSELRPSAHEPIRRSSDARV
jgi:hypothetical protein